MVGPYSTFLCVCVCVCGLCVTALMKMTTSHMSATCVCYLGVCPLSFWE